MRNPTILSAVAIALISLLSVSAEAGTQPNNTLLAGTLFGGSATFGSTGYRCTVASTIGVSSVFKRNATGPVLISLPTVSLTPPGSQPGNSAQGLVKLTFSSTTAGKAALPVAPKSTNPASFNTLPFSGYSQSWNSTTDTLTVKFTLTISNGCSVPITATYQY